MKDTKKHWLGRSFVLAGGISPKPGNSDGFRATDVSEQSKNPSRSQNVSCEVIAYQLPVLRLPC